MFKQDIKRLECSMQNTAILHSHLVMYLGDEMYAIQMREVERREYEVRSDDEKILEKTVIMNGRQYDLSTALSNVCTIA